MGNDDPRSEEPGIKDLERKGFWQYIHNRIVTLESFQIFGYAYVPPTPFQLKDWERYDVSRFLDVGDIPLEEGIYTVPISEQEQKLATIKTDLDRLTENQSLDRAIFLFHSPPYNTNLDRAAVDNVKIDHAPLDLHQGSIAIRRFIEQRQPLLTLHGHIHESARLSGSWKDQIGQTHMFSAAHDRDDLALVCFDLEKPQSAIRKLL